MHVALGGPKGYEIVTIRETYRIPGTKKNKTVILENLGRLSRHLEEDPNYLVKLKEEVSLRNKIAREANKPIVIELPRNTISTSADSVKALKFGHCIINKLWTMMGLDEFFNKVCSNKKNIEKLKSGIFNIVVRRLSDPSSILSCAKRQKEYAGLDEVTLDICYSILDLLADYKDELILHLGEFFNKNTNRDMSHVCFDVTNYYYESTKESQLRLFGFSKEKKNNEVLVVMGLLIDSNGIPITFKLFPGNTIDQNTLNDAVLNLKELYSIDEITVVADRGMNSNDNLIFLADNNHHFVISYTLKRAKEEFKELCISNEYSWDKEFINEKTRERIYSSRVLPTTCKAKVLLTNEERELIKEERRKNKISGRTPKYRNVEIPAYIHVTYSAKRAAKDAKDRERALEKLRARIEKGGVKSSIKYGVNKYLNIDVSNKKFEINDCKVENEAKFDGFYAIITDRADLTTEELSLMYREQWKIEDAFRILKTDLEARPIRVYKDNHIIGHFTMCYISLCIIKYLQYMQETNKQEVMSAARIMSAINEPQVVMQGLYPKIAVTPINISDDFLQIMSLLKFPELLTSMSLTTFKAKTKLKLNKNL